nr:MAG TPA: Minor capsid protein [Caudoviricetes sp.]
MLKGITITLYNKDEVLVDEFNRPIYQEAPILVENVLVAPESNPEVLSRLNLSGKKEVYVLAIPKGDANNWTDAKVEFFGKIWHTVGEPVEGIEKLIPLDWNKKVRVERYS